MFIVRVEGVSKSYKGETAVSNVSFSVKQGNIFGIAGSDGAGKTTLLRLISSMITPSSGHVFIDNFDVVKDRDQVKELIGYMPQRFGLYQDLTVQENLDFFMDIFGIFGEERKRRTKIYLGFSNLLPFKNRMAKDLSGGMKQKLGLACVLVHEPRVLILDEPTNGVDPVSRKEFWEILFKMRDKGMSILVSTSYPDEGEKCDRLLLMHRSKSLNEASPLEISAGFKTLEEAMIHRIQQEESFISDEFFKR
jgi:ABC-2 type transport system ATP-binding protein